MRRLYGTPGPKRLDVWVINTPEEIARWLAAPVALITTDRPDLFPRDAGGRR